MSNDNKSKPQKTNNMELDIAMRVGIGVIFCIVI